MSGMSGSLNMYIVLYVRRIMVGSMIIVIHPHTHVKLCRNVHTYQRCCVHVMLSLQWSVFMVMCYVVPVPISLYSVHDGCWILLHMLIPINICVGLYGEQCWSWLSQVCVLHIICYPCRFGYNPVVDLLFATFVSGTLQRCITDFLPLSLTLTRLVIKHDPIMVSI